MVTRLDRAYDAQVLDVRTKVLAFVKRSWKGSPAYRDADSERLIAAIVPRIEAGQRRVAELTDDAITSVRESGRGDGYQPGRPGRDPDRGNGGYGRGSRNRCTRPSCPSAP